MAKIENKSKTKEEPKDNIPLQLYNTLTREKEIFKPIKRDEVRIYVCGPTVNGVPHLGHARQQVFFDILRKTLKFEGYKVKFVSNITDVDDKIINKANELGESIEELTKKNTAAHLEEYKKLGVSPPDVQPKATEYIREMIEVVRKLEDKGYTYVIEGDGVYYDISKFPEYGKLSKQVQENKDKKVSRVKVKEEKKNKEDFVLWKFSKPGEPTWDSPWGGGRPGWHIECSAMSSSILGLPFDIHGGGQDLIFPHHEDEIAQSEAAFGRKLANYWVHNGMVNVENVKMSKSLGNFTTISDILKEYSSGMIRYFIILTHYRKPIDFSSERLESAKTAYERLKKKVIELKQAIHEGQDSSQEYEIKFLKAINDDLNTPKAIQVIWELIDDVKVSSKRRIDLLEKFDEVLGLEIRAMKEEKLEIPEEVKRLVEARERLRREKMWAEADVIRGRIKASGYAVADTPDGPKIEKI